AGNGRPVARGALPPRSLEFDEIPAPLRRVVLYLEGSKLDLPQFFQSHAAAAQILQTALADIDVEKAFGIAVIANEEWPLILPCRLAREARMLEKRSQAGRNGGIQRQAAPEQHVYAMFSQRLEEGAEIILAPTHHHRGRVEAMLVGPDASNRRAPPGKAPVDHPRNGRLPASVDDQKTVVLVQKMPARASQNPRLEERIGVIVRVSRAALRAASTGLLRTHPHRRSPAIIVIRD